MYYDLIPIVIDQIWGHVQLRLTEEESTSEREDMKFLQKKNVKVHMALKS